MIIISVYTLRIGNLGCNAVVGRSEVDSEKPELVLAEEIWRSHRTLRLNSGRPKTMENLLALYTFQRRGWYGDRQWRLYQNPRLSEARSSPLNSHVTLSCG